MSAPQDKARTPEEEKAWQRRRYEEARRANLQPIDDASWVKWQSDNAKPVTATPTPTPTAP